MTEKKLTSDAAKPEFFDAPLSILGYQEEEGEWVALALEMDLRGYGETFEEALAELRDLVVVQIDFAHFKAQPELIWRPADPVWWERFAEVRQEKFRAMAREALSGAVGGPTFQAGGLAIPPHHAFARDRAPFLQPDG